MNGFEFPDSLLLENVNPIQSYEEDQELSTHPGVKKRRETLTEILSKNTEANNKPDYLVGEKEFNSVRELSRFEICKVLVENNSYPAAIYHSFLLSKKYPNHKFLEEIKVKSLYGIGRYSSDYNGDTFDELTDSLQGEIQQVYHFVRELEPTDRRSLAAAHLWDYKIKNPKDEAMEMRANDMLREIATLDKRHLDELKGIEKKGKLYTEGILSNISNDNKVKKILKNKNPREATTFSSSKMEKGFKLGLNKVLFVNPAYLKINMTKKKQPIRFIESENRQKDMVKMIDKNAKKVKLKATFMDVNSLGKKSDAEKFNDIIVLEKWMQQKLSNPDGMIPDNNNEAMAILKKSKTKHVAFIGTLSLKEKKSIGGYIVNTVLAGSILLTPVGCYNLFKPNNHSLFYTLVIDAQKQDVIMSSYNVMKQKDRDSIVNANLYWMMLQMKRKPKK